MAFLICLQGLSAQPNLIFKRIEVDYPTIRLAFKVTCGGRWRHDLGPQNFEVRENGILVKNATIWCPDSDNCCISAVLIFDRSGSMTGVKIDREKAGGLKFVDQMNPGPPICDEAAIVSFREWATLDQGMTNDKGNLQAAINNLVAGGRTAVWDATKMGIDQLIANGHNRCRAVILLTDGGDNSSAYNNVNSLIAYALANSVKVFTIGFDITPGSREENDLQTLAGGTGGRFYITQDGTDLARIYTDIKEAVREEYQECLISYESGCPDGKQRMVDLTIKDFCGGSDTKTRVYTAPYDPSKFQTVNIRIGSGTVTGTKQITIPVYLQTPVDAVFGKCNITLAFDRTVCDLIGVSTAGTLLDSIPVSFTDIGSGYVISTQKEKKIAGDGILMYLTFVGEDVDIRMQSWLRVSSWDFTAYCLKANALLGQLTVEPRVPRLDCALTVPPLIVWNDDQKRYEPNPFPVSVIVHNTGDREAKNVFATITLSSSAATLNSPAAWSQRISPTMLFPGVDGRAEWLLNASNTAVRDSVEICMLITCDNYPQIACCKTVRLNPVQTAAISCALAAPDTIWFREQYYEPDAFDLQLTAYNTGTGLTRDLVGQVLQDTRFTIVPPAEKTLASEFLPGDTARAGFRVQVHPRSTDGYDTLRVHLQGNDTDPAWCEHPVWVQRERSPKFTLTCRATPDSLGFDERSASYTPNPFTVTTVAVNVGETYAEECQIMFVGPPRFTPVGLNLRPEGTMNVSDSRTEQWSVSALPRAVGGWDTLVFQVLGKGGLGRKIVVAECRVPVYVPATRAPEYTVECDLPAALRFEKTGYTPDPFPFSGTIRNTGTATGWNIDATLLLPQSVSFWPGDSSRITIPILRPGDSARVSWNLTAALRGQDDSLKVCLHALDPVGTQAECCRTIFVPKAEPPILGLSCTSIDTLQLDPSTGAYRANPFPVYLTIHNSGAGTAEGVRATISLGGSFVQVTDSVTRWIGNLDPGGTAKVSWNILAVKRPTSDLVPIDLRVDASNHPPRDCGVQVFIPAILDPVLEATCASEPQDTLHFDWTSGDFSPKEFLVQVKVTNRGKVAAHGVSATLVLPASVLLADGETGEKAIQPSELDPGAWGQVIWRLRALRQDEGAQRQFHFLARGSNAAEISCDDGLFVQGAPRKVILELPKDVLIAYGQKVTIPLTIDRTVGKDVARYSLDLLYDTTLVSLLGVSQTGTLTEGLWTGLQSAQSAPGRVRITNYTTASPLSSEPGILLNFLFEGAYDPPAGGPQWTNGIIAVDSTTALINNGAVAAETRPGSVITTNRCLSPSVAGAGYRLEQNRPNPFNPQTTISFSLPEPVFVRLTIIDKMGREVGVLVNQYLDAGSYAIPFEARGLSSDMYFYRLTASRGSAGQAWQALRKMILAR